MEKDQRWIPGSEWILNNAPAVGVGAGATDPASSSNARHVLTSLTVTVYGTVAQAVQVFVRDGASGVGPVIWTGYLSWSGGPGAGAAPSITQTFPSGLKGSYGAAMTIEFANGVANTLQSVSADGFLEDQYIKTPEVVQIFGQGVI